MSLIFPELLEGTIKKDFIKFLDMKDRLITTRTQQRYFSDINYFTENYFYDTVLNDRFKDFFNRVKVKDFLKKRKSSTARAALSNFLEFLFISERISPEQYLEIREQFKSIKKSKAEEQMDFLNEQDISFIFSNSVEYKFPAKDAEAKILTPLISALAYNLLFEQDHLIKLKWSDVDLEGKRVRNLRSDQNELACKWINIDDYTLKLIHQYKSSKSQNQEESFLFINNAPANNKTINKMLSIFKRKENYYKLTTTVDIQKLNRSRILNDLLKTEGKAAIEFIKILGLNKNTQLEHALEEFLLYENSKMI